MNLDEIREKYRTDSIEPRHVAQLLNAVTAYLSYATRAEVNLLGMPVVLHDHDAACGPLLGVVVATAGPQGCRGRVYVHGAPHLQDEECSPGCLHLKGRDWKVDKQRLQNLMGLYANKEIK